MNWIAFTALAVLSRALYGVMTKVLSNKIVVSAYTLAVLMPVAAAIISLLLSPLLGGFHLNFSNVSAVTVALVVISQGLGNILYFGSIKSLTNSTAQITFSSVLAFNTTLAVIFLNLQLSLLNLFGVMLLLLAVIIVTTGKIEFNRRGVSLMLAAAFMFAIFQLSSGELSKQVTAATYLVVTYIGAASIVFILKSKQVINDISKSKSWMTVQTSALTGSLSFITFFFAYHAYRAAPEPARVAMLLTAQVVATVVLSYFLLKEKDHFWRKVLASVLVVVSAMMIKN